MKNLIGLTSRDEIVEYVGALWQSEAFRESQASGGFIARVVEQFAWLPRVFAEETNDYLERAHFSTWWNVIMRRDDYTNPYIHDLYYLHEMAHAMAMPYLRDGGRASFDEKMQRNELEASVLSEIIVYFEMPGLRSVSFPHTIYADRFLDDPHLNALWQSSPLVAAETLRTMRRDVMVGKPEHLLDFNEKWIRRFAEQNAAFSVIWADNYSVVENHMVDFQIEACRDRSAALMSHIEWLKGQMGDDEYGIPFRQEADLFSPFYWTNKARYAAALAS